jgi:hypothetical protein
MFDRPHYVNMASLRASGQNGNSAELKDFKRDVQSSVEYQDPPSAPVGSDGENLESITRIRRLFSFSQLFAFSLTFMSTWEGMNTLVNTPYHRIEY